MLRKHEQDPRLLIRAGRTRRKLRVEDLTEVDPNAAALAFFEASKAMESYLSFLVLMTQLSHNFRRITPEAMLR
jgi:hypothetical protein